MRQLETSIYNSVTLKKINNRKTERAVFYEKIQKENEEILRAREKIRAKRKNLNDAVVDDD